MVATQDLHRELAVLKHQVQTFYQVNKFVRAITDPNQLLQLIMQEAESAVDAEASCIGILDDSKENITISFASGEKGAQIQHMMMPVGQGIIGHVAATNACLKVDDVKVDPRFNSSVDQKTGFVTRSILAVPISRGSQVIGVLEVINKQGRGAFIYSDVRLLEVVANQAAIALENANLVSRLVESERMASVGRLAASIVHEFKSPMTVVRGFVELMEGTETKAEDRRAITQMVLYDLDRMADMAQDILDYSTGSIQFNIKRVNIGDWLGEREEYLRAFFSTAKMELVVDRGFREDVSMDPERMRRVLVNVATNSREAMVRGGTFRISTNQNGEYWELIMEDDGKGIPPEIRPEVFKHFVTYGKPHGTGLGLAICKEIIDRHQGMIDLQSRVQGEIPAQPSGTRISIKLPLEVN